MRDCAWRCPCRMLAQGSTITGQDLSLDEPERSQGANTRDVFVVPANATLAQVEQAVILQALQRNRGNHQATARQLAIGPATLYRKCKTYQESERGTPGMGPSGVL